MEMIISFPTLLALIRTTCSCWLRINQQVRKDGVNVKGYFAWSLLDNYKWNSSYTLRFDIIFIDYDNNLKRHPKDSAMWFKKFLKK
ncbi:unnamed protein product, partial [Vitis vinifera]|uniref:Uncharacterized protein n=1 Tax=Vitis vinifera TaxID=29760 RepID=D7T2U2_VITVI